MPPFIDEDMIPDIHSVIFQKCTPAWELDEQNLKAYNLTYITQGEARYTVNEQTIDAEQGSLLILPYDCTCSGITFPDRLMQCFSVDFLLHNSNNEEVIPPLPLISLPGRREDIVHLFNELYFAWLNRHPGYIIRSRGLFLLILHHFCEQIIYKLNSDSDDSRINKVIRYMADHYSDHISVRNMAKMSELNPTYFGVLFHQKMGITLNRWIMEYRIKKAEEMLATGDYRVSDTAEACGFTDASHLNKQFKLIKGYLPSSIMPRKG